MVGRYFWVALLAGGMLWAGPLLGFMWAIDPYGVWPLRHSWPGINQFKPKRRDIDRALKPFEVWKYRPRTIFLGSSRIHESINPAMLDGTRYAPAYNAAIPANFLTMNTAQVRQYIHLNRRLKFVFVELFFWDFIFGQSEEPKKTLGEFVYNTAGLFLSTSSLRDSIATLNFNRSSTAHPPHVHRLGYWVYQPGHDPKGLFDLYTNSILAVHKTIPDIMLQQVAFDTLHRIVELCKERGIEVYFVITPNHPYDDYRIQSLGYWPMLEEWHRKVATLPNVLGFSQYTPPLTEPVSHKMLYWSDPLHPSMRFGDLMLRALRGDQGPDMPQDTLLPVNPATAEQVLEKRRGGLEAWVSANREFAAAFDKAKFETGTDPAQRALRKK